MTEALPTMTVVVSLPYNEDAGRLQTCTLLKDQNADRGRRDQATWSNLLVARSPAYGGYRLHKFVRVRCDYGECLKHAS
jgi:hypothetical protein